MDIGLPPDAPVLLAPIILLREGCEGSAREALREGTPELVLLLEPPLLPRSKLTKPLYKLSFFSGATVALGAEASAAGTTGAAGGVKERFEKSVVTEAVCTLLGGVGANGSVDTEGVAGVLAATAWAGELNRSISESFDALGAAAE